MTNPTDDDPPVDLRSPACAMHEAEGTGAGDTLESAHAAGSGSIAEVMRTIQQDEAHWCAMLARHIKALGAIPSSTVGALYGKAMAIQYLREHIIFLNRGQGWVVRKLREMLPRVRDNRLYADVSEMLRSHEANIVLAGELA